MNGFWKGLVASIAVYQLVLTYCMLDLADYFVWRFHINIDINDNAGLLDTAPGRKSAMILGGALIVLVAVNLRMLYRVTRPAQDG